MATFYVHKVNGSYQVDESQRRDGTLIATFHSEELAEMWARGEAEADEVWEELNATTAVRVERCHGALIGSMRFENTSHDGSMVSREESFEVEVCLEGGEKFSPRIGREYRSNYAHTTPIFEQGETIRDAMMRQGLTGRIARVVVRSAGHDHTEGREYEDWDYTTVYVPMSGDVVTAKDLAISLAAKQFAAKEIGFGEFKRVIRENS